MRGMTALVIGIVLVLSAIYAVLPADCGWLPHVIGFLKGGLPIFALIVGMLAIFIGIVDIKDRIDAKKEGATKKKE